MLLKTFDPDNRLVADSLEAEWNNKLRSLAEAQEQYEQQTQKQRILIDSQTREQLLSLAKDFPRVWNDPAVEPRERKRILRLLVEDVTLINGDRIPGTCAPKRRRCSQSHVGKALANRSDSEDETGRGRRDRRSAGSLL